MFKAYNSAWPRHEALREAARGWYRAGLLPLPQLEAIRAAYPPDFYRPNIYLRILLFLLMTLGYFAAAGMLALLLYSVANDLSGGQIREQATIGVVCLLSALGGQLLLRQLIRTGRTYRAGSDQALLYISLGFAAAAMYCFADLLTPNSLDLLALNGIVLVLLPVLLLLVLALIAYADALVAIAAYAVALALVTDLLLRTTFGILFVPFAVIGLAVGLYTLVRYLVPHTDFWYYQTCFIALKVVALLTFYLGGNYLVVREASAAIRNESTSHQISFALFFYLFTALIPLLYIYQGLRRPDRVWLLTGLVTLAFSGYTVRFYHSVLPPTVASALLGALLIVLMALALRYLRTPRHGLTAAPNDASTAERPGLNLEALIVAQTAHAPQVPEPGFQFGGGQSGGGGAEGQW
ncbi:hypothetical protein [Hymenobacter rubripertinctus]|uniref:DUF2157 domain-containing protein n=1 Tax=Hymenobacter rubripertinctus TaxID=2029981 RepID=A0A418R5U5_9BACT|nr:hypothetical protein [Hymenobacter rubripertinctus]RIY12766.1 hypothetical protein D0T11_03315 [Hymenobacter rubripertinctus]